MMKNEKRQMTKEIDIYSFFIVFLRLSTFSRSIYAIIAKNFVISAAVDRWGD
jgi:uncharacterized protein with PQ loop repeat